MPSIQPVHQAVQRVVADGADVLQDMDWQNDVRTLLPENHPADARLLAEEQKTRGSCRQDKIKNKLQKKNQSCCWQTSAPVEKERGGVMRAMNVQFNHEIPSESLYWR